LPRRLNGRQAAAGFQAQLSEKGRGGLGHSGGIRPVPRAWRRGRLTHAAPSNRKTAAVSEIATSQGEAEAHHPFEDDDCFGLDPRKSDFSSQAIYGKNRRRPSSVAKGLLRSGRSGAGKNIDNACRWKSGPASRKRIELAPAATPSRRPARCAAPQDQGLLDILSQPYPPPILPLMGLVSASAREKNFLHRPRARLFRQRVGAAAIDQHSRTSPIRPSWRPLGADSSDSTRTNEQAPGFRPHRRVERPRLTVNQLEAVAPVEIWETQFQGKECFWADAAGKKAPPPPRCPPEGGSAVGGRVD